MINANIGDSTNIDNIMSSTTKFLTDAANEARVKNTKNQEKM